jgi:NAD(P)-dependent dehydrogenase (short-subunit alcohol dehydrogenase family)
MITGALTGIGRATALAFAHEGARIVVSGRRDEAGKAGVPAKRIGTPEEIAQTIVFLASDKAPFLTGQSIAVDGGKLAS